MFRESIPVLVKKSKDKGDSNLIYETMLMTELQHENIPFLFGVNSAEKLLVMEFCALQNGSATESATSLESFIRRYQARLEERIPWPRLMSQICFALAYSHSKGWLHTDVKSNNIVLSGSSASGEQMKAYIKYKVLDFFLNLYQRQ